MHHQVGGVGLDDGSGAGLADDVGLCLVSDVFEAVVEGEKCTMSQPSFAEAMAEKYGAPV